MRHLIVLMVALVLSLAGSAASAKSKKHKGKKKADQAVSVTVAFSTTQRSAVRHYFAKRHGKGKCPPGLAKKHNGCLPPGQAKKRYRVGHALADDVTIHGIPDDLVIEIGPPPSGYTYGIVDGDLVQLAVGTMLVVDAIDGLVED